MRWWSCVIRRKTMWQGKKSEMLMKENPFFKNLSASKLATSRWLSVKVVFERSKAPLQEPRFLSSLL